MAKVTAMTEVPYEFLVRWKEGKLAGAHVGFSLLATMDDGTMQEAPQNVQPVDIGQGNGFPLKDILDKLHVDALTQIDKLQADLNAAQGTINEREAENEKMKAAITAREQLATVVQNNLANFANAMAKDMAAWKAE